MGRDGGAAADARGAAGDAAFRDAAASTVRTSVSSARLACSCDVGPKDREGEAEVDSGGDACFAACPAESSVEFSAVSFVVSLAVSFAVSLAVSLTESFPESFAVSSASAARDDANARVAASAGSMEGVAAFVEGGANAESAAVFASERPPAAALDSSTSST
ncbi:hypothetical protein [Burkholderia sp. ABCPW 111]|uniref:hypothetical protein n=1 Tax=Burkholderia sp. ABCPW 111 TaxID=1820025 RepID=UPI00126A0907|nr:hypothetical protein [Burkholderia sp. ABCPW 111]